MTQSRIRHRFAHVLFLTTALAPWLVACGDSDSPKGVDPVSTGKVVTPEPKTLALAAGSGCTIDSECAEGRFCFQNECAQECAATADCGAGESCTSRGRCITSSESPSIPEVVTSVTTASSPETAFAVFPGQRQVMLRLSLTAPPPGGAISYTVSRSDEATSTGLVQRAAVSPEKVVEIPVDVGKSSPELGVNSTPVQVLVKTNIGAYRLALVPQRPISAAYGGSVKMDVFGPAGLPLTFEIVTDPPEAALAQANSAWLVLPVGANVLFSPINAYLGAPTALAALLTFDTWLARWVAVFDYPYALDAGIFNAPSKQTNRILRFEIESLDATHVVGRMVDRWEGLYDERSTLGVTQPSDLVLAGDLSMEQLGPARSPAELPSALKIAPNVPTVWPLPSLNSCGSAAVFPATPMLIGTEMLSCGTIGSAAAFAAATPAEQAACAIASVESALAGATTTSALRSFLDQSSSNQSGLSFAEFIENCARGTNGTCVPSAAVLCSRQLVAYAYRSQPDGATISPKLIDAFLSSTQEAYLGRQLAAFKTDADTRLTWLKTTDYPAIVTSAVRSLNEKLMADWESGVLDVHMGVMKGYFDPAGMAVLSQATSDATAGDSRSALLAQMVQGWRATMDSLTVGAQRWNELYDRSADRATKAANTQERVRDLYLAAAAMVRFSRDSSSGYQATAFGAGFSNLMRALNKLSLSFDDLMFSRDAEVVVSSSLDPTSTNNTLLSERAAAAVAATKAASTSVQTVLDAVQAEALNETQLRNRLDNEINSLRDDLVDLCGLPAGCTAAEFRTNAECRVLVKPGLCGFSVERATDNYLALDAGSQNVSEAGRTVLAIVGAYDEQRIAQESLRAHKAQLDLELRDLDAFANDVQTWNNSRLAGLDGLNQLFEDLGSVDDAAISKLMSAMSDKATKRAAKVQLMKDALAAWSAGAKAGADTSLWKELAVIGAEKTSELLGAKADFLEAKADAAADGLPKSVGTSTDPSSAGRLAIKTGSSFAVYALKGLKAAADYGKSKLEASLKNEEELHSIELTEINEQAEIDTAISDNELESLNDQIQASASVSEKQRSTLRNAYDLGREQRAAELAYSRDAAELRSRRNRYLQRLQEGAELDLRVQRAQLGTEQKIAEYLGVVQRAELQNARLSDLDAQRGNVLQIVGSPAAFFAKTNRVAQAEDRLTRAKDAMMDWLVALEYFAVRPFIDQRLQILLARNPFQLEQIATQLVRLQGACGGAVNHGSTVLSVRKDLLGLTRPIEDSDTQKSVAPDERFRMLLESGNIPVDKRLRYTTDASIGDLMRSERRVMAATFDISLDNFANLAASCNAKIEGLMVQFVGDVGSARPTATVLYDGTSRVRSCQPKLAEYVDLIGRDRTNFAPITSFRTAGRAASPVAGINKWPADTQLNKSFGGLPLASQYTVLIDAGIGENATLDFSKLNDILLRVDYAYSDFFPVGSCE